MKIRDWIVLVTLLLLASGCSPTGAEMTEAATPTPTSSPLLSGADLASQPEDSGICDIDTEDDCGPEAILVPTALDDSHEGWKAQNCELCHDLPRADHDTSITWECAACHGGNGACELPVSDEHREEAVCIDCHGPEHSFVQIAACTSCHFADFGTDDCSVTVEDTGAEILGLASVSELVSGCRSHSDEAGSQNDRPGITAMPQGEPAIDFSLNDIDGNIYTLSGLLETKPVLLVLGGYT